MPAEDDDDRDASSRRPLPPPEDRLWRHPSELGRAAAAAAAAIQSSSIRHDPTRSWPWAVAAVMGMVGVTVAVGTAAVFAGLYTRVGEVAHSDNLAASNVFPASLPIVVQKAREVAPAVARLEVRGDTAGSAVVFRDDGYLITSAWVVAKAKSINVVLADGREFAAELVGLDLETDVAVVHISESGTPAASLATTHEVAVGAECATVDPAGEPGGDAAVEVAVVRAVNRDRIETEGTRGDSSAGRPLVDDAGRVVGITTGDSTGDGPSAFATPIRVAAKVATDIISVGRARHPWLGVVGVDLEPTRANRLGIEGGAVIRTVVEDSPAEMAQIAPDDIVVAVAGHTVTSMAGLVSVLRAHRPGDEVGVVILRDGKRRYVDVLLVERRPSN